MTATPAWAVHLPPGQDPAGLDLLAARSLPDRWLAHWASDPARSQLHDPLTGWCSRGELEERSRAAAGRLRARGLVPGDRVVISAASSRDLVAAHVGCLRAGLVVVPVNTAYRSAEIAHVVHDSRPALAVVDDAERGRWVEEADPAVVVVGPDLDGLAPGDPGRLDGLDPGAPALLGYTSGTTGRPKGAVLSHGNLLASAEALAVAWRWTADDRLVLCLPLFHMHGLGVGLHGTLTAGGSAVLQAGFSPDAVFDAAVANDASLFFGVPTMYTRLLDHARAPELGRLRLCVSGSAPLAPSVHRRFEELCGWRLLERYGMTETAMLVSNPYDGERRPGTVGLPLPGVEVRLEGDPAEVLVRGPNVFGGYWERPDANGDAFVDGWFRTGDLGELDEAGYLVLSGRAKELIISGGFNVYPREIEDALLEHPGIAEVAVTGTPDPEWGEVVTAWIVGSDQMDVAVVRTFLADRLAPFKQPRIVHCVDTLPRNALGKVQKHLLGR